MTIPSHTPFPFAIPDLRRYDEPLLKHVFHFKLRRYPAAWCTPLTPCSSPSTAGSPTHSSYPHMGQGERLVPPYTCGSVVSLYGCLCLSEVWFDVGGPCSTATASWNPCRRNAWPRCTHNPKPHTLNPNPLTLNPTP
jgi:hypothetical protein